MNLLTEITLNHYLALSGALFALGFMGVILRRNILVIYMSLEIMLQAGILALVAFSRWSSQWDAQILALLVIVVAAAEVAIGLALITAFYRLRQNVDVENLKTLKF
ncbi:MAG: NADH-quinone oxidoreductase subunit NuoK [Verrucomicrobiota bacterium]